jgi:hypothetical protein
MIGEWGTLRAAGKIFWLGKWCVSQKLERKFSRYLFHERINDVLADNLLRFSPEAKDIVRPETLERIGHGFRFVRVQRQCGGKYLIQVRE